MLRPLFKCEVESLIVYVYWIKEDTYLKDFETIYKYQGRKYGMKGITITDFEKHKEIRSGFSTEKQEWQLPRKHARNLLRDMNVFLSV